MKQILILILAFSLLRCGGSHSEQAQNEEQMDAKMQKSNDSLKEIVNKMPEPAAPTGPLSDAGHVLTELSGAGLGVMRDWRSDETGFMSSTPYYEIGAEAGPTGLKNNLAFYAESPSAGYIKEIKLMLNLNNANEADEAKGEYAKTAINALLALKIHIPKGFEQALKQGDAFLSDGTDVSIVNEIHHDRIDWYKLTVTAK